MGGLKQCRLYLAGLLPTYTLHPIIALNIQSKASYVCTSLRLRSKNLAVKPMTYLPSTLATACLA